MRFLSLLLTLSIMTPCLGMSAEQKVVVGSKMFGESYLLSEILAQYLEANGVAVERKMSLGGTLIVFEALIHSEIDVYPEYTGTFAQVITKDQTLRSFQQVKVKAETMGLHFFAPLGFNNTYGMAVTQSTAQKYQLKTISDLKKYTDLDVAFNFEFYNREDGWPNLKKAYQLNFKNIKTLEQTLSYQAVASAKTDLIVVYSTDGKVLKYNLAVLEDDKNFFPTYEGAFLARQGLSTDVQKLIANLSGKIDQQKMIELNSKIDVDGEPFIKVARDFLVEEGFVEPSKLAQTSSGWVSRLRKILWLSWEHIYLVLISTLAACFVGIPLGVVLFRYQKFATPILYIVGLLQTIPSLALLVYMIPLFGVSVQSALMALFLYSLLPILQNTFSGLQSVSPRLVHAAQGIGLYRREILWTVELPLAASIIIAGVRVAAVINVGTATIAAFIGSGGLGELIVQGLTLNDLMLMQQGAIPAALLAIVVNIGFSRLEKVFQTPT